MSFFAAARRVAVRNIPKRNFCVGETLSKGFWRKSNINYITYICIGCIALEITYSSATDFIWDRYNQGKQYKDIDWSKFKSDDDDEEEE